MEARTVNEPVDIKPSVRMSFSLPLQALEYAQDGVLPAVCVRILRVYRRKMMHSGQQEERYACVCTCGCNCAFVLNFVLHGCMCVGLCICICVWAYARVHMQGICVCMCIIM